MIDPSRKARLIWQCRRGMLELDLLLAPLVMRHIDDLNDHELDALERLLAMDDPDLYALMMFDVYSDDQEVVELVKRIAIKH